MSQTAVPFGIGNNQELSLDALPKLCRLVRQCTVYDCGSYFVEKRPLNWSDRN